LVVYIIVFVTHGQTNIKFISAKHEKGIHSYQNTESYRLATSSVHYVTICKHSLALLRMGEIIARNMLR